MVFDPNSFLRSLNFKENEGRAKEFSLRSDAQRSGRALATDDEYRRAPMAFREKLRDLVNEWIESGQDGGIDEPRKRRLGMNSIARIEASEYLQWNHPRPQVTEAGDVLFRPDLRISRPSTEWEDDPIARMRDRAVGEFISLLQSELKHNIARCERCHLFFFRKKLRSHYKRGSYCLGCRRAAAAQRKTKKDRERAQKELLRRARAAWAKWPRLSKATQARHGSIRSYVLSKIRRTGKTAKWVTRNMPKEGQMGGGEESADAKGKSSR